MEQNTGGTAIRRRLLYAAALLLLVLLIGIAGYMAIEGMGFIDSLYMTVITIATVGYGEVQPLGHGGRLFTIFLIVVGLGIFVYFLSGVVEFMLVDYIGDIWGRRKMRTQISGLRDHYVVCGYGRVGESVTRELLNRDVPFVVIEQEEECFRECVDAGLLAVRGDATKVEVLIKAGVKRARGLVSALPADADNLYVTLSARELNPDLMIVARTDRAEAEYKLGKVGADRIVFPHRLGGKRMANLLLRPEVRDFLDVSMGPNSPIYDFIEVEVPEASFISGRTIKDCGLREKTGMAVLSVRKGQEGDFETNPHPDTLLEAGDTLILIGTPEQLNRLEEESELS